MNYFSSGQPLHQMQAKYATVAQGDQSSLAPDGIQVFQHATNQAIVKHQPNFSRVTEREAEEEDDSLDEKWERLQQDSTTPEDGLTSLIKADVKTKQSKSKSRATQDRRQQHM